MLNAHQKGILNDIIDAYKSGDMDLAESMVRAKGLRKGWSEKKMRKRTKWRRGAMKAWAVGQKIPFRPFGGAIVAAGQSVEKAVRLIQEQANK